MKFKKPRKRTYELFLKSPLSQCSKIWEMLKPEVQKATTKVQFKNAIKFVCSTDDDLHMSNNTARLITP